MVFRNQIFDAVSDLCCSVGFGPGGLHSCPLLTQTLASLSLFFFSMHCFSPTSGNPESCFSALGPVVFINTEEADVQSVYGHFNGQSFSVESFFSMYTSFNSTRGFLCGGSTPLRDSVYLTVCLSFFLSVCKKKWVRD